MNFVVAAGSAAAAEALGAGAEGSAEEDAEAGAAWGTAAEAAIGQASASAAAREVFVMSVQIGFPRRSDRRPGGPRIDAEKKRGMRAARRSGRRPRRRVGPATGVRRQRRR
ncbi:MAG: hypothetical protein ABW032_01695, partial [Burkholderiaceae bacterium]